MIRMDRHEHAQAQADQLHAAAVIEDELTAGRNPGVEQLAREVEADVPRNHTLHGASGSFTTAGLHEDRAHDDTRGDVGREVVSDSGGGERDTRRDLVTASIAGPIGDHIDRHA